MVVGEEGGREVLEGEEVSLCIGDGCEYWRLGSARLYDGGGCMQAC